MVFISASALALVSSAWMQFVPATGVQSQRPILNPPPYPANMVDNVRRPGFNGRVFITRPIIGGMEFPVLSGFGEPGPERYGAYHEPHQIVWARVGLLAVPINPWQAIPQEGLKRLEFARQTWLRENNYIGGVRTFVNDLAFFGPPPAPLPQPRATLTLPPDMPPGRGRLRVEAPAAPKAAAVVLLSRDPRPMRISTPAHQPSRPGLIRTASGWMKPATSALASRD